MYRLFFSVFLFPTLFCYAQPDEKKCKTTDETVIGNASQRPSLEYQSGKGKDCVVYRVRNSDKGVFMPVLWKQNTKILLGGNVKRRNTEWINITHPSSRQDSGETTLSYGVNQDEFSDKVTAYRDDPQQKGNMPLTTIIDGTFVDSKENDYRINLLVTSFHKEGSGATLAFEIADKKATDLLLPLVDVKLIGKASLPIVSWKPAADESFRKALANLKQSKSKETISIMEAKGGLKVTAAGPESGIAVREDELSVLVHTEMKTPEVLLRVSVSHYGSKER